MDDCHETCGIGLPLQGPHWQHSSTGEGSSVPAFLRLNLQPGGLTIEVTKPSYVIGRHSETDLRLPLPEVSRRHCRFYYENNRWHVADMNSLNGIFVNGERVQEAALNHHDQVAIGSAIFQVELQAAAAVDARRLAS